MSKVKRRRVNWFKVMLKLNNSELNDYFFELFTTLRRGRTMSQNRCAYYTLKHFYSTTTIAELCKKVGI